MKIAIKARIQNGYLREAIEKIGSAKKLAEYLGVPYTTVIAWLNFDRSPNLKSKYLKLDYAAIEKKFVDLTGVLLEDVFPPEILTYAFRQAPKKMNVIQEISLNQLQSAERLALPAFAEEIEEAESLEVLHRELERSINKLSSPRQQDILRMRFGFPPYDREYTLGQIAEKYQRSRDRIRQIEEQALRRLRHPSRSGRLKQFIPSGCEHLLRDDGFCVRCEIFQWPGSAPNIRDEADANG